MLEQIFVLQAKSLKSFTSMIDIYNEANANPINFLINPPTDQNLREAVNEQIPLALDTVIHTPDTAVDFLINFAPIQHNLAIVGHLTTQQRVGATITARDSH